MPYVLLDPLVSRWAPSIWGWVCSFDGHVKATILDGSIESCRYFSDSEKRAEEQACQEIVHLEDLGLQKADKNKTMYESIGRLILKAKK